jgi:hypothetical protein
MESIKRANKQETLHLQETHLQQATHLLQVTHQPEIQPDRVAQAKVVKRRRLMIMLEQQYSNTTITAQA